ncbi:leucine-rich repeat receptor-like protein kinase [Pyrus ussuriensis x Pyrus communis]|uniref:Leucine-rich repeat receptor-like protein kinase n=1 Tax=Pyrus ussuriensis x Pyrus communis TaxID=2448454 RepID=A0A5N5GYZ8_9ROSA|nr:leucine-rich repeat receptor-like protein kinase [Pyrus ussuriensis x Pyrus communis]
MEGDRIRIRCLNKLFRALIVVFTLLQCAVNPSLSLGFKNISSEGVVRCFEREREALLAFKHGLVDHYHLLSSWGREEHKQDCCKWVGVHCSNRTNHVTQLHLGWYSLNETYSHQQKGDTQYINYFLQGKMMSPKLLELQHLKYLDLSSINFNGTRLPYFIGSLSNLKHLDLYGASFGGRFPSQVGNLTHLQYLDLRWNDFNGAENLNSWLPHLSSLTYLDLSTTNLSNVHDWLETVSKLPKLTNLRLRGCGLPSPVIHSSTLFNINSSKSLAHVDLSDNQCTSPSIYLWLSNYNASLVYLDLRNSSLTGLIPSVVENLTSLVYLSLSQNKFDAVNPHSFSSLCSLQELYLGNTSLSGQFSKFVQMLSTCVQNSLESLYLSNNHLSGSIPDLTNFSSLKLLFLSTNQLSGTIPESIGQLSNLEDMDLSMNALKGVVSESHFSNLSRLTYLDLSSTSLALSFNSNWAPPFQLDHISLGSSKMGPYFPKWLQTQNEYSYLNISDAGIVDILPSWFWGTTRDMTFISLSNNQIGEMFANSTMNFMYYPEIHLSSNQIEGPIPSTLSHASYLDLSNNNISGSISILCEAYRSLTFLNLSSNNLSRELPECLTHFDHLVKLDLSYNAFSGKIPSTVGSLYQMETLKLRSNRFIGELPSSFKNCTSLKVIDVGYNELSGPIPKWLGVSLQKLVVLMLSSNNFNGSMPSELCRLTNIQNLDVSANNISGTIPKCLSNFTVLAQKGNSSPTILHSYQREDTSSMVGYMDDATFVWKGRMHSYKKTLGLVKRIDFSRNRLTGQIPIEITYLVGLISLNLSRNRLTGELPAKIGKLQELEILDLSRNQMDGRIPTSLARIDRLSVLDLSYNNFIGKIPTGTQLQSFDPSNYAGNPQLCGPPLQNMCDDQQVTVISSNEEEKDELITWGFYVSMALGFIVGFWGVCGSLIFIKQWRYSFIRFLNVLDDWLYVRMISIKWHLN